MYLCTDKFTTVCTTCDYQRKRKQERAVTGMGRPKLRKRCDLLIVSWTCSQQRRKLCTRQCVRRQFDCSKEIPMSDSSQRCSFSHRGAKSVYVNSMAWRRHSTQGMPGRLAVWVLEHHDDMCELVLKSEAKRKIQGEGGKVSNRSCQQPTNE